MATLNVVFGRAMDGPAQVISGVGVSSQSITTSASSQASTVSAGNNQVCELTVSGGNVWVAFGASPTASAGTSFLLVDGQTRHFGHLPAGTKVAVINA